MISLRPGDKIGDWVVEGRLGEGAMAAVYRCRHGMSQRMTAAVKLFRPDSEVDQEKWFTREVEALAALHHPNIVRILHPGEDPQRGVYYLAMELVEGETLRSRLTSGPLSPDEARACFAAMADAMAEAHRAQIYHRDLKPSNVVIRADGTPVILDFGIATASDPTQRTMTAVGTPTYMAPELFEEGKVDPARADIYSLGVMLHEALTGKRAFGGATQMGSEERIAWVIRQKIQMDALDPGENAGAPLRELVRTITARDPGRRPGTMTELARALREPGTLTLAPPRRRPKARRQELWMWVGGALLISLVAAGIAGFVAWSWVTGG
ncbi:MAG TPA: serine/threonine-protein kinase [Myxococcota bacterium]|nr:serine/threonine-protein kinase [Myxococcota bacterium]